MNVTSATMKTNLTVSCRRVEAQFEAAVRFFMVTAERRLHLKRHLASDQHSATMRIADPSDQPMRRGALHQVHLLKDTVHRYRSK